MRDDLDFLYKKAMRSKSIKFMDAVEILLVENGKFKLADKVQGRLIKFMDLGTPRYDKFSFLVGDSQKGQDWYENE